MKVTYHALGAEVPQIFDFEVEDAMESQLELLEKTYARVVANPAMGSVETWLMAVFEGQASARRVLLWHLLNQVHKTRVEDVDFRRKDLKVEESRADLVWLRDKISTSKGVNEEQRQVLLDGLDADIAKMDAQSSVVDGEVVEGKALSPSSDEPTG